MQVIKVILTVIDFIVAFAVIVLAMVQTKEDAGLSSTITGSSTNNFYEKNKGRTREGMLKKWTIIMGIVFAITTIALSIIYIA